MRVPLLAALTAFPLAQLALATGSSNGLYELTKSTSGAQFYEDYTWENISDPTLGRVNYVNLEQAIELKLTKVENGNFFLYSDDKTVLTPTGPGRNSQRIQSKATYLNHLIVGNFVHMPTGLGTWPAFWEFGQNWPYQGEIDIIEGVNDVVPNQSTIHTGPNCTMPSTNTQMTGTVVGTQCDAFIDGDAGCGARPTQANNYGVPFNENGGGWYAMEKTPTAINVWFWARNSWDVPAAIREGLPILDTAELGEPYGNWVTSDDCVFSELFAPENVVINLTFCGTYAGAVFVGGNDNCTAYVDNNPEAFTDAYWEVSWLNIYETPEY